MHERSIFKVSLIIILVGLSFLFIYTENLDLEAVRSISDSVSEDQVKLKGVIEKLRKHEKALFLNIEGERVENIDVVVFVDEDILVEQGDYVEISGEIEEYKGKKEVIANEIKVKGK